MACPDGFTNPRACHKSTAMSDQPDTTANPRRSTEVDPKLLEILVCPVTRGPLEYDKARGELVSRSAGLAYPVREGVPVMLPEEARQLDG